MPVRGSVLMVAKGFHREKDLPVKKEFDYNPIGSFMNVNPYDMAFCYPHPLYHRPFVVKGGHQDVQDYLRSLNIPIIAHHTFYRNKGHRQLVGLYGIEKGIRIQKDYRYSKSTSKYIIDMKYQLVKFSGTATKVVLAEFKRIPRRWIRELNLYTTTERRSFHDI